MKRIYFLMLLSCVFACERHDVPETVVEEPDVEITASFDSLSTSRAYYSISVGTDVRAGRYKFVWTASTDNRYEPLRAELLTCICPDTSFAVSCGDSLDIVPGQKLGISSPCSIYQTGTHSFDFALTSFSDTLECEIAFIRPLVYNYDLIGISNSQRYSLISEEWANYHGEAYFPFTFPQDSIVRIGRHLKDIIMPDIYKPATYISDYEFKVTADDGLHTKTLGSIYRYYDPDIEKRISVEAYSITPQSLGHGVMGIEKGPYQLESKRYYVYEPLVLEVSVVNNYYISASLLTALMDTGAIGMNYSISMEIIRESDGKILWAGYSSPGSVVLDIKNSGRNLYDKIINFSDEYALCKRKMYEYSADRAVFSILISVNVPYADTILKGYNLIGTAGKDFVLTFSEGESMEVIYE